MQKELQSIQLIWLHVHLTQSHEHGVNKYEVSEGVSCLNLIIAIHPSGYINRVAPINNLTRRISTNDLQKERRLIVPEQLKGRNT